MYQMPKRLERHHQKEATPETGNMFGCVSVDFEIGMGLYMYALRWATHLIFFGSYRIWLSPETT